MRIPFRALTLIALAAAAVLLTGCHDGVYTYSVGYSAPAVHHRPYHYHHGHHYYRPRWRHRHHHHYHYDHCD